MPIDWIYELFEHTRPNGLTIGMGKRIRKARQELGLSQEELAKRIYRRRPSLSDMENGKMEPDASTLLMLAIALDKPLTYFYPPKYIRGFPSTQDDLSPLEQELIRVFRRLPDETARRIAIPASARPGKLRLGH